MRGLACVAAFLVGLLVLTPFVVASTVETWTDGIYDAESDELAQATKPADAVVDCLPLLSIGPVLTIARAAMPADDPRAPSGSRLAPVSRAPPLP